MSHVSWLGVVVRLGAIRWFRRCSNVRVRVCLGCVALWLRVLIAVASGDHSESESGRSGNLLMMGSEWEATLPLRGSQSQ